MAEDFSVSIRSKKIIAKYNDAENDIEKCSRFFCKNNWDTGKYTHTKFRIKKEKFEENFIPKFSNTENSTFHNEIKYLFFNELSEETKTYIKEQSEKMLSNGLLPFNDLDSMVKCLSIFAFANENLIAWSVMDLFKYNETSVRSTFVVPEFRHLGLGMYLWYLIVCKGNENNFLDQIKWFSFDFQKDDYRLNKLYTLLFGKILQQSIDYFISEKTI